MPDEAGQTNDMSVFNDIESVPWARESIEGLYKKGVVSGKEPQKFYPTDNVSREEFVKMLVAAFDIRLVGEEISFEDVPYDAWYYDYIKTAYIAGVVSGVSETLFGTGQDITRQDICTMTYRMLKVCDVALPDSAEATEFNDADIISDYAAEAVTAMQKGGIINGDENGSFNPHMPATRAETAKITYGVLKLIGRS